MREDPRYENRCTLCGEDVETLYNTEYHRLCNECWTAWTLTYNRKKKII